jgi:Ca2+-binding RTX toxin-like protein
LSFAEGGSDQIFGGTGNDSIVGMRGADDMTGGSGSDTFQFLSRSDSIFGQRDHVMDFNRAEGDRFDFNLMDANANLSGNQNFVFANGASTQAGTLWVEGSGTDWTVFVNVDGGAADMAIDVTLAGGATNLLASDFVL